MSENLFDLSGEVAVVIGATGALGGACALAMAKAGARVAVAGRNAERGEARVQEIADAGGQAQFFACDAMDPASLKSCHEAVGQALGAPTVLLNAAGGNHPDAIVTPELPFEKIPLPAWASVFDLNLVGGLLLPCQEFGPAMCGRGRGSIINIGSRMADDPTQGGGVLYSTSKAAVHMFSFCLADEVREYNVAVNVLSPGSLRTEGSAAIPWTQRDWHERVEPSEVGPSAVYLAKQDAQSLTGQLVLRAEFGKTWGM